jgi:peptidoglycan hydrolase-like protein with peptidoglycan-binding domain
MSRRPPPRYRRRRPQPRLVGAAAVVPAISRVRSRQAFRGLAASLTAVTLLAACGAKGVNSATTTASESTITAATAVTTTAISPVTRVAGTEKWIDLQVGDCLADLPPSDLSVLTVTTVDCATPHLAEAYFRAPIGVNAAISDLANRECAIGFSQYTGRSVEGSPFAVTYLIDSNQDRTSSDTAPSTVICLLEAANGQPLTESARR